MQPITVTLNGREVTGEPGMTILELARKEGVHIPTLCHESHLTSVGDCPSISTCRICFVEDERTGAMVTACGTFIVPGMVINTHSPRVLERRKTVVELMLASHPDSCLVCDKGNRCQLRQVAAELGIGLVKLQKIPQPATINDANPFIKRDLSKCILCAKCIRACQELVVEGAIDYFRRGFTAKPATFGDTALEESECTFCGTCVSICPTGALMEAEPLHIGTTGTVVRSTCPFCGCGCSLLLKVYDERIVRATPNKQDAISRGTLCVKGSFGFDFIHSPDRLTIPLIKVNGDFKEATWEEALDAVAGEFKRIKEVHGSDSLAVFGSSKCTNEENYMLQCFARCVLGTNNIDNSSRLHGAAGLTGPGETGGIFGTTNSITVLEEAEVILVIGADPTKSAPLVGYAIKRAVRCRDAKLILVDPRESRLALFANLWLRPKIATDLTLVNSLCKTVIDENLVDDNSVNRETADFKALAESLGGLDPAYIQKATGVAFEDLQHAARIYANAERAAIVYGSGVAQQVNGTETIKALFNLALLTGKLAGQSGVYALQRENNAQGACDMGVLPDYLPGYHPIADRASIRKFKDYWGDIPDKPGLTVFEMLTAAKSGEIKGMYIVGENPVSTFPLAGFVQDALSSLEFLVVQDMFLTETAKLAKVVLPAVSFAEKEGTFTSFDGRINWLRKALKPLGQSLPDCEIITRLAVKMGSPMSFMSPQEVREEIEKLIPMYRGIGYGLSEEPEFQPEGNGAFVKTLPMYRKQPEGTFGLLPARNGALPQEPDKEYPFVLLTGSNLFHSGGGTRSSRATRLSRFSFEAYVSVNEADAEHLGVADGDKVRVLSPAGDVVAAVKVTDTLPQGTLYMPFSVSVNPVSQLFDITLDDERKSPLIKAVKVKLERVGSDV
ncbi:MAG: molybdopterin-dependent oxidoreductase [Bacillota bacterium]